MRRSTCPRNLGLISGATELRTQRVTQLRSGARTRASVRATLPTGQRAAGRYLIAFIDSGNVVAESHEDNNVVIFGPIH